MPLSKVVELTRHTNQSLAVSGGDPAGIGPDISIGAWLGRAHRPVPRFTLYTDARVLRERAAAIGADIRIEIVDNPNQGAQAFDTAIPVVDIPTAALVRSGKPDTANGASVIRAIERATADVIAGAASALVTNPIAKHVLYGAGFNHPGHTEFLAELASRHCGGGPYTSVMMLAADTLRVVPLTIHEPLADVPRLITPDLIIRTARILAAALTRDYAILRPRIAVAGLNPHAGENGAIGREDIDVIAPAIAQLAALGMAITGPHSADTLFHAEARERYDAVIAMYHDQALIPLKTLAFDRGVNITLGLPFVRTSPDHGTAFDIAGTGKASAESFIAALLEADRMAQARRASTAPR